jgi:hypothetical protein|nr:MAG TPA: hypothetical protein [Caudoviricetes sp.]
MRLEDIPNALVPKVDAMFTESFAIRHVVFADEEHPEWEVYRTFRDDFVYDLTQRFDWKGIRQWAECKDVFVDFFGQKYRRYAVACARHLISKDYRPATLHVRDMDALRFSVARFDGQEKILMDDLKIFTLEDGRVVTC